jgi:site-specific DNA recombinase
MTNAITYSRVSTLEQAQSGYSLRQQTEALRAYCEAEGWRIVDQIEDGGHSGADLVRPGLDRLRDRVAQGGVQVVIAQDRDRFAREPYLYLLKQELTAHGCLMRTLNGRGDDSPEGELTEGIIGQIAKFERAKLTERSRRGRTQKARQGKVLRGKRAPYGFRHDESGEALVVHEEEMATVERMFRMAANGLGPQAIMTRLNAEGLPSPTGRAWVHPTIRQILKSDLYVPYSREELAGMVPADTLARLEGDEAGVWWFGKKKTTVTGKTLSEPDENGERRVKVHTRTEIRPVQERVGVPVPAHLPRRLVDEARARLAANRPKTLKHEAREWELRGLVRCSCGWKMGTHTARSSGYGKTYSYYTCNGRRQRGKASSCQQRAVPAEGLEQRVWEAVESLLGRPEELVAALDRRIEREKNANGNPEREAAAWARRIEDVERQRERAQDAYLAGAFTVEELTAKLAALDGQRGTAEKELAACRKRGGKVAELERARDALLNRRPLLFTAVGDDERRAQAPEERREVYREHRIEVKIGADGEPVVTGLFGEQTLCDTETLSRGAPDQLPAFLRRPLRVGGI